MNNSATLFERAAAIQLIVMDVDGVLTDSKIVYNSDGAETKAFNVKDGLGISLGVRTGLRFGIITARESEMVQRRAKELAIEFVIQKTRTKLPALEALANELNLELAQLAYVGDDLPDMACLENVGLPCCPSDAAYEVKQVAALVSNHAGGHGAIREIVEFILECKTICATEIRKG